MTQRTVVVLVAAAVMFAAAVAGQADDALRWRIKQLQAELNQLRAQAATHAQLEADLENERRQKDTTQQTLASVQEQLRDAQASLVQAQDREAALQQDLAQAQGRYGVVAQVLSSTQQRLAEARALSAQLPGARQALSSAQDELAGTQGGACGGTGTAPGYQGPFVRRAPSLGAGQRRGGEVALCAEQAKPAERCGTSRDAGGLARGAATAVAGRAGRRVAAA